MFNSEQVTRNRRISLEVENSKINKRVQIWDHRFNPDDMWSAEKYVGEWNGEELLVSFQHFDHGFMNLDVYKGAESLLRVSCKACNENPMSFCVALGDREQLHLKILAE